MGSDAMTARLLGACEHPLIDAIGHPTGRLIERRAPYELDMDALFAACARTGTILEINANPARRDLSDVHARAACAAGAQIAIDSDAHRTETLQLMRYGVWTARRAWLTAADVVNTLPWPQLRERLKRAGAGAPARPPRDPRSRG
jgi:DNA polymerase (family 10)